MPTCTSCRAVIESDDTFCTSCGAKQVAPVETDSWDGPPDAPVGVGPTPLTAPPPPPPNPSERTFNPAPIGAPPTSGGLPGLLASDQLLGQAAPNTMYVGQRLMYEKEQALEEFDPLRSTRFLLEVARRAFLMWLVWAIGCIPVFIVAVILGVANHTFGTVIGVLLLLAWCFVMACVFWLSKLPGQLSEWKFTVDDKGQAAPVVFDHVAWALQRRNTPMDSLSLRRFKVMSQGPRDVLEIKQGIFRGFVSCFENGVDLYIGWTFWLYLSPARYLWTAFRRLLWELRNKGHAIYVSLQFDRAKALREALHSAVREGVDVAAGEQIAHGQGTIGSIVPVVSDSSSPWEASDQLMTVTPSARSL
jgi:hypothetical protein